MATLITVLFIASMLLYLHIQYDIIDRSIKRLNVY